MAFNRALLLALDFARLPGMARSLRKQALPPDLVELIRIAANCPEAGARAVQSTGVPLAAIRPAVVFYLEQMLFFPGADAYRTLGAAPGAPRDQLNQHRRWLMRWLHPDVNGAERAGQLAARVLKACDDLRLENRQARDDSERLPRQAALRRRPSGRRAQTLVRLPWVAVPVPDVHRSRRPASYRRLGWTAAAAIIAAVMLVPDSVFSGAEPCGCASGAAVVSTAR